jgi:predicted  nucleic acid-binding Zn-ribbon protein
LGVILILKPFLIKIQNLKKELADLQKNDIEKSNRIEKLQNQVTLSRDEKDSLEQKIVTLKRKIEEVWELID